MSRTNPFKKKKRQVNEMFLVFGEGSDDEIFLKHLKNLYHTRSSGIGIKICKGKGGTADGVVIDADKVQGAFKKRIVVLDNDKSEKEMTKARQEAKNKNIELIENTPCLEYLFLLILDKKPNGKNSDWCKKKFESDCIDKKKRDESNEYAKIFTKKLLDAQRLKIPELDKLISIMEGNSKDTGN